MDEMRQVTVLGTGLLGTPVAVNLQRCGFDVTVWNRTHEKTAAAGAHGCRRCERLIESVAGADAVITLLADANATNEVLVTHGALRAMPPGSLLVQSGTIGIAATACLARIALAAGVEMVDAPVSGSRAPAESGELTVLAGGSTRARALAQPLLAAMGNRTHWAGGVGDGMRLKLLVQTWLLTLLEALAETVALTETAGIDPSLFLDAIAGGPLDMQYAQLKGAMMRDRAFAPAFPLKLVLKDALLARELAEPAAQAIAPMLGLVADRCRSAITAGHGEKDMSAIFYASGRR